MQRDTRRPETSGSRSLEETEREASAIITQLPQALQGRAVVRGITIDSPASKDLDDAFWLERDVGGGYRLDISIADVGSFVTTETQALDRAAQQRAFTRYLVERQVPMLPRFLSEDALSLLPEQVRPAITLSIPLDERLHPGSPSILPTVVCSERRFSSEEVDRELTQPHTAFAPMLQEAVHLATALLERRRATGALAFYDLHQGWATTEEGLLFRLHERERHQGHILVQELMILANQVLATWFAQRGILALYRNHTTKAIAPARPALLELIEDAVRHPEQVQPERVQATVTLALERARYASTVQGHFGLNLPVYLHLTSPLRRYADLVNQRILFAALSGAPPPYTQAALESIASHINAQEDTLKDVRKARFRAGYDRELRAHLADASETNNTSLESLPAKSFHSILRLTAEEHVLPASVEHEINRRLELQILQAHDLFTLLFRFPQEGEAWERVKHTCLRWLHQHPHHAVSLLMMGYQSLGWQQPVLVVEGLDQQGFFQATVSLHAAEGFYTAGAIAPQKERAKQQASAQVVAQMAGISPATSSVLGREAPFLNDEPLTAEELARTPPSFAALEEEGAQAGEQTSNSKGQLLELAHADGWEQATFVEIERTGPAHAPRFLVEAGIIIDGIRTTAQGMGKSKAQAEQAAARQLLLLLPHPQPSDAFVTADKSAISLLNELKQAKRISEVVYTYILSGSAHEPLFTCMCSIRMPDGSEREVKANGKTKKEAAEQAAQQALQSDLGIVHP